MKRSLQRMSALLAMCLLMQEFHLTMQVAGAAKQPVKRQRRHAINELDQALEIHAHGFSTRTREKRALTALARLAPFFKSVAPLAKIAAIGTVSTLYIIEIGAFALAFARMVSDVCLHLYYPEICDKQQEISQLANDIEAEQDRLKANKKQMEVTNDELNLVGGKMTDLNNNNFVLAEQYNGIADDSDSIRAYKLGLDETVGADMADKITLGAFGAAFDSAQARSLVLSSNERIPSTANPVFVLGSILALSTVGLPLAYRAFAVWRANRAVPAPVRRRRNGVRLTAGQARQLQAGVRRIQRRRLIIRGATFVIGIAGAGLLIGLSVAHESEVNDYLSESLQQLRVAKIELLAKNANATRLQVAQAAALVSFGDALVNVTATYDTVARPVADALCEACDNCAELTREFCAGNCGGGDDSACSTSCEATQGRQLCESCDSVAAFELCAPTASMVDERLSQQNMLALSGLQTNFKQLLGEQKNSLKVALDYIKVRSDSIGYIVQAATLVPPRSLADIVQDLQLSANYPDYTREQVLEFLHAAVPVWTTFDGCDLATAACWDTIVADGVVADRSPAAILADVRQLDATKTLGEVLTAIKRLRSALTQYHYCLLAAPYTCAETKIDEWIHRSRPRSAELMLELLEELGLHIGQRQLLWFVAGLLPGEVTYKGCSLITLMC